MRTKRDAKVRVFTVTEVTSRTERWNRWSKLKIRLSGKWLDAWGFADGARVCLCEEASGTRLWLATWERAKQLECNVLSRRTVSPLAARSCVEFEGFVLSQLGFSGLAGGARFLRLTLLDRGLASAEVLGADGLVWNSGRTWTLNRGMAR